MAAQTIARISAKKNGATNLKYLFNRLNMMDEILFLLENIERATR